MHRHYGRTHHATHSNALLLQAKCTSQSSYTIPANEQVQLRLYQHWPRFTYVRSGPQLNGQVRDVMPKARHDGAQYLLIDDGTSGLTQSGRLGLPGTHCIGMWPAQSRLYPHVSFAEALWSFAIGLTGRPFEDDPSQDPSNWSQVVWDLLQHSLRYAFNRRRIGIRNHPRAGGDPLTSSISGINFCMAGDDVQTTAGSERQQLIALHD